MKPWNLLTVVMIVLLTAALLAGPVMAQTNSGKDAAKLAMAADTGPALTLPVLTLKQAPPVAPATPSKFSESLFAVPNSGPALGGGVSYQFAQHLWGDAFAKRGENLTDACFGASTDMSVIGDWIVNKLFGITVNSNPASTRIGAAYAIRERQFFADVVQAVNW